MQVMDLVWKCFSVMLFLVIIYIVVWRDPTTISNRHSIKIDEKYSYSVNKTNSMLERKRRDYKYRTESIRSVNESFILTRKKWKTKRRFKDENNRSKPLIHPVLSTTRKTQIKTFDVRNGKRTKATQEANLYDTSKAPMENKTSCTYYFDKGTLAKARQTLSLPNNFMLYYINIKTDIFPNSEAKTLDDLLHWQYILKGEQFLVQLPVDIDLITFGLLFADHEETVIKLTLYSNSNCHATITDAQDSIRSLLWNELFGNNSDYYLCNRNYKDETLREIQYAITTIWVGYDLSCWSSKDDPKNITFEKDRLPLVAPVLSYLLSLHFVWIFVVLDIGNNTQHSSNTATVYYKRNDRPFGLKRFFTKVLHGKFSSCCKTSYCTPSKRLIFLLWLFILLPVGLYRTLARKKYSKYIYEDVSSVLRLSEPFFYACGKSNGGATFILDIIYATFMPIFFLYFGKLFEKSNVCTTYESNSTLSSREQENTDGDVDDENIKLVVDILLSPCYRTYEINNACIGLKCCCYFYHKGCLDCEWTMNCCCFKHDCKCYSCTCKEKDYVQTESDTEANARGSNCCQKDCLDYECNCRHPKCNWKCGKREYSCGETDNSVQNVTDSETNNPVQNVTDSELTTPKQINNPAHNATDSETNNPETDNPIQNSESNCCDKIVAFCRGINNLISCLFPVHHLVCELSYMFAVNFIECLIRLLKCSNDTENQRSGEYIEIEGIPENVQNCNYKKEPTCITYFLSVIIFIILWIVLRPVISTFTFIIRSFTYFVFVTLPTREHIMRYTLIAVTTVTQFSKYLHEVINMNQEILDYIFEGKMWAIVKILPPNNDHTIEEETFNHIYWELKFVKRTLYFLILKMFIVFMYIFITIETLITYPKSLDGSFQDIVGFLLLIIGPYAISLFFKANQENFLSDENKREIVKACENCCNAQL